MKLNFLGKGAAFYPQYGNTCAYFIKGTSLYLLDCGETVYETLFRKGILENAGQVYVILTHLHADHVGSLGSLISYFYCLKKQRIHVIHPLDTIVQLLRLEGIGDDFYQYHKTLPDTGDGLSASPVEVPHADNMTCFGYVLKDEETSLYYSGDSSDLPEKIRQAFLRREIQNIYHDTSSHDSPHPSHCYYGKLADAIPRELRSHVHCMHLDSNIDDQLYELGFSVVKTGENKK